MNSMMQNSVYFGIVLTLGAYYIGIYLKKKLKSAVFNPLLVSIIFVIVFLIAFKVDYDVYNNGGKYVSFLLTPATVCLAIPLYKQLEILKKNFAVIISGIFSGVVTSTVSVFVLCKLLKLGHVHYVTLLPKSITTAIGMGVSEEAGGIVTLTVLSIVVTGIFGNIIADGLFKIMKIHHPVAKGLALGTSAHAIGTAKALELGEIEGAMSSLSIAVAGLMTVIAVPIAAGLI